MSDYFTFNGTPFVMIVGSSGETPHWMVTVEATDRKLIGTDRFERSIRSRQYRLEGELWIEPNDSLATAAGYWRALQDDYVGAATAALVSPAGTSKPCIIVSFDVVPLRGGVDGFRGKVVFGLPGGI